MKKINYLYAIIFILILGCSDGYIDEISSVDPGTDETAPTVTINYPLSSTQIRVLEDVTAINIRFTVQDDIEVQNITISVDGTEVETITEFIDYRNVDAEVPYDQLSNGQHTVTVTATDGAGKSTSESVNFEKTEPYEPMEGEVFYMPFDGEVVDLITLQSGSTSTNGVSFVDGVTSSAIRFDGSLSAYALFQPTETILDLANFTLSFWTRPEFIDSDDNGGIDGVLGLVNISNTSRFWGNMDIFIENGSNPTDGADMRLHTTRTDITGGLSETWISSNDIQGYFGEWSHNVLSYDASSGEFNYYLNGNLITTAAAAWGATEFELANSGPMVFGTVQFQTNPSLTSATGSQPWASYLTGEIDEVRIFEIALSEQEIVSLYESEKPN